MPQLTIQGMEVKVVGGGIIGLSIAWELARAGVAVSLHDAGEVGREASWAAAGMLAPGGEYDQPGPWTDFALHSLDLYPQFVLDLANESGVAIDYRECGALELAITDAEADALATRATRQAAMGIPSVPCPHSGNRRYPRDAVVNPRDVVAALRVACINRGVRLIEHSRVEAVAPEEITVLAAGPWSSVIHPDVPESFPVRGHLISFNQPPGTVTGIIRHNHAYLVQRSSGELIAGASSENAGFDRAVDPAIAARLAADAARMLPALAGLPYKTWLGFRPASATEHPIIERHADRNLWLAYGHSRNGILLAPATAKRIAASILGTVRALLGEVFQHSP